MKPTKQDAQALVRDGLALAHSSPSLPGIDLLVRTIDIGKRIEVAGGIDAVMAALTEPHALSIVELRSIGDRCAVAAIGKSDDYNRGEKLVRLLGGKGFAVVRVKP